MIKKVFSVNDCPHRLAKSCKDKKTTVANRSLDIAQVVAKFASGQPLDLPPGQYGTQMVAIGDYDLSDRYRLKKQAEADMKEVLDIKKKKAVAAAEAKRKADIDAAVADALAKKEQEGRQAPAQ